MRRETYSNCGGVPTVMLQYHCRSVLVSQLCSGTWIICPEAASAEGLTSLALFPPSAYSTAPPAASLTISGSLLLPLLLLSSSSTGTTAAAPGSCSFATHAAMMRDATSDRRAIHSRIRSWFDTDAPLLESGVHVVTLAAARRTTAVVTGRMVTQSGE